MFVSARKRRERSRRRALISRPRTLASSSHCTGSRTWPTPLALITFQRVRVHDCCANPSRVGVTRTTPVSSLSTGTGDSGERFRSRRSAREKDRETENRPRIPRNRRETSRDNLHGGLQNRGQIFGQRTDSSMSIVAQRQVSVHSRGTFSGKFTRPWMKIHRGGRTSSVFSTVARCCRVHADTCTESTGSRDLDSREAIRDDKSSVRARVTGNASGIGNEAR